MRRSSGRPLEREQLRQPVARASAPPPRRRRCRSGTPRASRRRGGRRRGRSPLALAAGDRSPWPSCARRRSAARCARPARWRPCRVRVSTIDPGRGERLARRPPGRLRPRGGAVPAGSRAAAGAARSRRGAGPGHPGRRPGSRPARARAIPPAARTSSLATYGRLATTTSGAGSSSPAPSSRSVQASVTRPPTRCSARFSAASSSASVDRSLAASRIRSRRSATRKRSAIATATAPLPVATSQTRDRWAVGIRAETLGDLRDRRLGEQLRLGPRDERAAIGPDAKPEPLLEAAQVGDRLARRAPLDQLGQQDELGGGDRARPDG